MKKIFIVVFALIIGSTLFFSFPETVFADDLSDSIEKNLDDVDLAELDDFYNRISGGDSLLENIRKLIRGEYEFDYNGVTEYVKQLLLSKVKDYLPTVINIILIAIVYSVFNFIKGKYLSSEIDNILNVVCYFAILLVILSVSTNLFTNIKNTIMDDYRMKRLWAQPDRYLAILELAGCVASPDFSIYQDTPEALNIYCHYMKHWLAAYWQSYGIKVIPTMGWGTKKSFSWCFDGEPQNSTVIVSSIGWGKEKDISGFMRGYDAMLEKLNPSKILFYGQVFDECEGNIEKIEPFYNIVAERRKMKSNV